MNVQSFIGFSVAAFLVSAPNTSRAAGPSDHMKPCSAQQATAANKALADAKSALAKAIETMKSPSDIDLKRQQKWFGALASDSSKQVQSAYETALVRATFSNFWCPVSNDLVFKWDQGDLAAVHKDAPGAIFLTPDFFKHPVSGADSQLGIFVHELSHLAGIGLRPEEVYGMSKAKTLASNEPARARNNSDNYQYYVEDILFKLLRIPAKPVHDSAGKAVHRFGACRSSSAGVVVSVLRYRVVNLIGWMVAAFSAHRFSLQA